MKRILTRLPAIHCFGLMQLHLWKERETLAETVRQKKKDTSGTRQNIRESAWSICQKRNKTRSEPVKKQNKTLPELIQ